MDPALTEALTTPFKAQRGRPLKPGKKRPPPLPGCEKKKGGLKPGNEAIVDLLREDPAMTQRDMVARLNVALSTVQRYIKQREHGLPIVQQQTPPPPDSKQGGAYVVRLPKGEGARGGLVKAQYLKFIAHKTRNLIARVKRTAGQRPIYWMQDGASVHGKAETQALCAKHGIRFVGGWPPGLNPIENFWAILKRAIGKEVQLLKNTEENRDKIVTKVDGYVKRVNPRMCQRLCSARKRFKKVRENKGKF
jgi:transposase